MDDQEKRRIVGQSSQTLQEHLFRCTLSIFNTKDSDDPGVWGVFSGTLFELGGHLLVATASHCLDQGASLSRYWILDSRPRYTGDGMPRVIAAHGCQEDRPDVGVLEIDKTSFAEFSTKVPCPIERIRVSGAGGRDELVSLIGAPGELVEKNPPVEPRGFKAVVFSYTSTPVDPSEPLWTVAEPVADAVIDVLLDYPAGCDNTIRVDTNTPYKLPNPKGMSGGGLWNQGFEQHEVWSPEHAFLFGIQSAWYEGRRYVRGVQIVHWLRLVYHHYPDLQAILAERFPILIGHGN